MTGPIKALLLCILLSVSGGGPIAWSLPQDDGDEGDEPGETLRVSPVAIAGDLGTIAGQALFCNFDPEEIEEFMVKAEAAINEKAEDASERIISKLEFNKFLSVASAKGPEEPCSAFTRTFFETLNRL